MSTKPAEVNISSLEELKALAGGETTAQGGSFLDPHLELITQLHHKRHSWKQVTAWLGMAGIRSPNGDPPTESNVYQFYKRREKEQAKGQGYKEVSVPPPIEAAKNWGPEKTTEKKVNGRDVIVDEFGFIKKVARRIV